MTPKNFAADTADSNILFLPHIYTETMQLLAEAHDYFHNHGDEDQQRLDEHGRSLYCSEMSRLTMRLSCIMAWLLARRAVTADEKAESAPINDYRLDCQEMCLHQHIEAESLMPPFMNALLERSYELYERIQRLDESLQDPDHPSKLNYT